MSNRKRGLARVWEWMRGRQAPAIQRRSSVYAYAGARQSRLEWDWLTDMQSADKAMRGSLRKLRMRARQQVRDNPTARNYVRLFVNNVTGPRGFTLQMRFDRAVAADIPDYLEGRWAEWGRVGTPTVDGRLSWLDVERQVAAGLATDGEVFLRRRRRGAWGFQLELIDPDRVDETLDQQVWNGRNRVVMGIEQDADGRPLAYHILDRHQSDGPTRRERVPAEDILHIALLNRPGQTRGEPPMAAVLLTMKMQDGYREAVLVAARAGASKSVVYEQDPEALGSTPEQGGAIPEELAPGVSQLLPPGVKAVMLDPTQPSTVYREFDSALNQQIAMGLGVSYAALTGDLSAANYSSARVGLLQERDSWRSLHELLTEHLHHPVFAWWLESAVAVGQVRVRGDWRQYLADTWQARGFAWVDPQKDIEAKKAEVALGVTSRTRIAAEQGVEIEDVLQEIADEERLAKAMGVTLESPAAKPAPATKPVAQDGAAEDDDEATDGKGAAAAA